MESGFVKMLQRCACKHALDRFTRRTVATCAGAFFADFEQTRKKISGYGYCGISVDVFGFLTVFVDGCCIFSNAFLHFLI